MQFTIPNETFLPVLKRCNGVAAKSDVIPILSSFYFQAYDKTLTVRASDTNLEVTTSCAISASKPVDYAVCVPGAKLVDIISHFPHGEETTITYTGSSQTLQLTCGRSRYKIGGTAAGGFPEPAEYGDPAGQFDAQALRRAFARVGIAITMESNKYGPPACIMRTQASRPAVLEVAGTDSHRMAMDYLPFEGPQISVLVPFPVMRQLPHICDADDPITFGFTDNHVFFSQGSSVLVGRRIEGRFPDVTAAVPKEFDFSLELPCKGLRDAVNRAVICAHVEKDILPAVVLRFGSDGMGLFAQDILKAYEGEETIELAYSGKPFNTSFSAAYLTQPLDAMDSEQCCLEFNKGDQAFLLRPKSDDDPYRYLVMPRRI